MQFNLAAVTHTVCKHVADPNNGGQWSPAPLGRGHGWPLKNTLLPTCYSTKFVILGQAASAQVGSQKFGDAGVQPPWEMGVDDPL